MRVGFEQSGHQPLGPVVLMVSGGADSTALLVMAATDRLDIEDGRREAHIDPRRLNVLHINHMLRGIDADKDEEFVKNLALNFGIPCTVKHIDAAAKAAASGENLEDVGRRIRYKEAQKLADRLCDASGVAHTEARILTAHTADDRAETFCMNVIRGSGTKGLSSIPRIRGQIVRPLLNKSHKELTEYLLARGIAWREDASNKDIHYLRAYVRKIVLPAFKEKNPQILKTLGTTCSILSEEDRYLTGCAEELLKNVRLKQEEGLIVLDKDKLLSADPVLVKRAIRMCVHSLVPEARPEARHIESVLELIQQNAGSVSLPMNLSVVLEQKSLFFIAAQYSKGFEPGVLEVPGEFCLGYGSSIKARLIALPPANLEGFIREHVREHKAQSVLLDAQKAGIDPHRGGKLRVDVTMPGDTMCPLGMKGRHKKISDLMQEACIPTVHRSSVAVIRREADGCVVWLAGIRMDERVKCGSDTNLLLELTLVERTGSAGL